MYKPHYLDYNSKVEMHYPILSVSIRELSEAVPFIMENHIQGLSIGEAYDIPNASWSLKAIKDCTELKTLYVSGAFSDFSVAYDFDLEELSLDCTFSKDKICLDRFPNLRKLSVMKCENKISGLGDCSKIEFLQTWNYQPGSRDLQEIGRLKKLNELTLISPKVDSLYGISECKNLKKLKLGYSRTLREISHIQQLGDLQTVEIYNCKRIEDFECLKAMPQIRRMIIDACGFPADLILENNYEHLWINK